MAEDIIMNEVVETAEDNEISIVKIAAIAAGCALAGFALVVGVNKVKAAIKAKLNKDNETVAEEAETKEDETKEEDNDK